MKIARYWKRADMNVPGRDGEPFPITGWGWSENDEAEAKQRALDSVQNIAARLAAGKGFPDSYNYASRPRREEIVEEIRNEAGETIAVITRNHYGSLVMNTSHLMFIDVDVPFESSFSGWTRSIKQLFGIGALSSADKTREQIKNAAAGRPDMTFRVYRTLAGFRVAVTSKRIAPSSSESRDLFTAFGADKLYVRLCGSQESFRARLSPKHWRCGATKPPVHFPYETPEAVNNFGRWKQNYELKCGDVATCSFVEQVGATPATRDHSRLIEMHDRISKADEHLRLA